MGGDLSPPAELRGVDDVVVQQRGGVDELDGGGELQATVVAGASQAGGGDGEQRAQTLGGAGDQQVKIGQRQGSPARASPYAGGSEASTAAWSGPGERSAIPSSEGSGFSATSGMTRQRRPSWTSTPGGGRPDVGERPPVARDNGDAIGHGQAHPLRQRVSIGSQSMNDTTEDRVLDGRVKLRQPTRGYRAGLDAALLAAACDAQPGQRAIEAGCGAGGALLAAATRRPAARFTGVERDPVALELARENIAANGLEDRVEAVAGDVGLRFSGLGLPVFDAAFANPPFFDDLERSCAVHAGYERRARLDGRRRA